MPRAKQTEFSGFNVKKPLSFGGSLLKGHPKTARTVVTQTPMHLVLRSSQATGKHSLLMNARKIEAAIMAQGRRFGVRVYALANAGNHLHLVVRVTVRQGLAGFLRAVAGIVARITLGCERGQAWSGERFWDQRPFSRIISWGREFRGVKSYLMVNRLEMAGFDRMPAQAMLAQIRELQRASKLVATGFE